MYFMNLGVKGWTTDEGNYLYEVTLLALGGRSAAEENCTFAMAVHWKYHTQRRASRSELDWRGRLFCSFDTLVSNRPGSRRRCLRTVTTRRRTAATSCHRWIVHLVDLLLQHRRSQTPLPSRPLKQFAFWTHSRNQESNKKDKAHSQRGPSVAKFRFKRPNEYLILIIVLTLKIQAVAVWRGHTNVPLRMDNNTNNRKKNSPAGRLSLSSREHLEGNSLWKVGHVLCWYSWRGIQMKRLISSGIELFVSLCFLLYWFILVSIVRAGFELSQWSVVRTHFPSC